MLSIQSYLILFLCEKAILKIFLAIIIIIVYLVKIKLPDHIIVVITALEISFLESTDVCLITHVQNYYKYS